MTHEQRLRHEAQYHFDEASKEHTGSPMWSYHQERWNAYRAGADALATLDRISERNTWDWIPTAGCDCKRCEDARSRQLGGAEDEA